MFYWIAANLLVVVHLGFICFVLIGGFLVFRWRRLVFLHIPAVVWGALIEYQGWLCPLTPWEQQLRQAGGMAGHSGGFIEHYLLPVLYPAYVSRDAQFILGTFVIVLNLAIYGWMIMQRVRGKQE